MDTIPHPQRRNLILQTGLALLLPLLVYFASVTVYQSLVAQPERRSPLDVVGVLAVQLLCLGIVRLRHQAQTEKIQLLRQTDAQEERLRKASEDSDLRVHQATRELRSTCEELRQVVAERERIAEERESLQQLLVQAQKMESLGLLAGGVAHDFNNLLTVILGNLDLARTQLSCESLAYTLMEEAETAAKRAAEVTDQLLSFSRKQVMRVESVDLRALLTDTSKMVARLLGEDIGLRLEHDQEHHVILADRSQLRQVILNLVVNARDAMPSGGTLTLKLHRHPSDPAGWTTLSVTDTGEGMAPAVVERIFEPFFTTKGMAKGTGLGLSTVHGLVTKLGGKVEVVSKPGHGSTFSIHLPLSSGRAEDSGARWRGPAATGSGRILLVEDDDQLRVLATKVLRRAGYLLVDVPDGEKALELTRDPNQHFDLLLTDVVMPGIDGGRLATLVRETRPDLPVLFMSGYADDKLEHLGIDRGECNFLAKPFIPSQLSTSVSQSLSAARNV